MLRNLAYNLLISKLTRRAYQAFFDRAPKGARILDIGVGNGLMLKSCHRTIRAKQLEIFGVDLNEAYLKQCAELIRKFGLDDQMTVRRADFLVDALPHESYDIVFFSMSLPLITDKHAALAKAESLLSPEGRILLCQTMQTKPAPIMELIKPHLKYISSVDFGEVNYESDFNELIAARELRAVERLSLLRVNSHSEAQLITLEPQHQPAA